jgi:RHH-type proline utilization regulon transcriptional repressor/proline dehydrogenase/delta 1-pyrroline-5-carboxylate dehydrogenase
LVPTTFTNQPPIEFAQSDHRRAMQDALDTVRDRLGIHQPLFIGGQEVESAERGESRDPSHKSRLVGTYALATRDHALQAVAAAKSALPGWAGLPVRERAEFLQRAADLLRDRLFEYAAWEVFECGKGWREATADIDEAIDFCEFYAAEAIALQAEHGVDVPGEENRFDYLPRGVVGVIAPWNFPLAILTGMSVAALATGNTVVMKPSEQSAIVAAILMDVFREAGLPAGVLNYLPGRGEVAGAALVEHPDLALIAFTGSRQVGLSINAKAAEVSKQGVVNVKRVIAEMGGKNAIIVAADADLDEAVAGVVKSAFGYQGQKCSACSRAIVVGDVYEPFLKRLMEATKSLKVGPAEDSSTSIGPVIDDESFNRIHKYIEIGKSESRLALAIDPGPLAEQGWFIGPHIFAEVPPAARIAQEEIFGPVLAVIRAADLTEALRIANGTDYALTGGIFSRSPAALDRARREFMVGNLYLNRPITGALVGRQPFGGFKMSGIGSKAGGRDYLLQFVVPRTITEHTIRRGFAPSPDEGE